MHGGLQVPSPVTHSRVSAGILVRLTPPLTLNFSGSWAFLPQLPPCPYNLAISAMMLSFLFLSWASSQFCLPLPFSCALSLSSPGLFSLPYLFSLLLSLPAWRLPDASGCALFHIYSKNLLLTIHGAVIHLVPKPLVFMVGICSMLQVYMGRLGGAKGNGKWYNYITILKIV